MTIKELMSQVDVNRVSKILSEVFFWGIFPEDREKKVEELYEKLTKPMTEKELIDSKSFTEIMKKHTIWQKKDLKKKQKKYEIVTGIR